MEVQANGGATSTDQSGGSTGDKDKAFMELKAEKARLKEEAAAAKAERDALAQKFKELEERDLTEKQEFKKLAELKAQEAAKAREELDGYKDLFITAKKQNAFNKALGMPLERTEYYSLVDFKSIGYDPESGEVDPESAKNLAAEFAKTHPKLVSAPTAKMPSFNPSQFTPGVKSVSDLSRDELAQLILKMGSEGTLK